jgi:hypothetical protein
VHALLFDWPCAALLLGVALAVVLLAELRTTSVRDPRWVLGWLWPMYLFHMFEEHGIDVLGRRYAFLGFLCQSLGYPVPSSCPATPEFVFAVNVLACQVAFGLAFFLRRTRPLVAACAWGIPLVNAVAHVLPALATGRYNPGLLTALVLFVPGCSWMLTTVLRSGLVPPSSGWRIVATGVLTHVVLIGSVGLRAIGMLPVAAFLLINAVNGLWPLVLGRSPREPTSGAT